MAYSPKIPDKVSRAVAECLEALAASRDCEVSDLSSSDVLAVETCALQCYLDSDEWAAERPTVPAPPRARKQSGVVQRTTPVVDVFRRGRRRKNGS